MDGIGSIGALAGYAAQPLAAARSASGLAEPAAPCSDGGDSDGDGATGELATQYQMSVLSKVMYASADQALALIQMLPRPGFRAR
jgi:hypothetical protein